MAMLSSTDLPDWTFIDPNGLPATVALSAQTRRVRAIADHLSRQIPAGSAIGLVHRTGPDLVIDWLACVLAGLEPLILQYPTTKQSRDYWIESIRSTIGLADVRAIVADDHCAAIGLDAVVPVIAQATLDALAPGSDESFVVADFSIIQLSSGTTGHRKAIRFTADQLTRHATDFDATLRLDPARDRIVSWLPLYHDMGYIACFVMPMLLGVPVTMIDPMTWVATPDLLFDTIARDSGTICYMPNFGFEVMARQPARALPTMRHWISCSEPTSPVTARKFLAHIDAEPGVFSSCYAMAENVFAVCLREGLATQERDGVDIVSCGRPIANVNLRLADDGEIWVRSPASLASYLGGVSIVDADGFYPTGDLGFLHDGELFVAGRKQDLLVQAGRKFMLSDIDLALNRLMPDVKGRGVAVQVYDERLGTQKPVVLIEAMDFMARSNHAALEQGLKEELGLDQVEVDFVPPRFLTKTSSGKFNRRLSAQHWLDAKAFQKDRAVGDANDPLTELRQTFGAMPWDRPVSDVLDSLSLTVLRIVISDAGVRYDPAMSLDDYASQLETRRAAGAADDTAKVIRIVSIADRNTLDAVDEAWIEEASRRLGAPIHYEHICLPPTPILLSDLVFHDWFQCRLDQGPFTVVSQTFDKLRRASVILVDDKAEISFALRQVYGVLSHGLRRDPRADQITIRWQRYPQFHDRLPLSVIAGVEMAIKDRPRIHELLQISLGAPLFRLAMDPRFARYTGDWEFHPAEHKKSLKVDGAALLDRLVAWAADRGEPLKRLPGSPENRVDAIDLAHYCSSFADRKRVEQALDHFHSFVIVGQPSSAPFIRAELERRNKPYQYAHSYAPEVLQTLSEPYDCVLACGSMGPFRIEGPAIAVMATGQSWNTQNIDHPRLRDRRYYSGRSRTIDASDDWFYPAVLGREEVIDEDQRLADREQARRKRQKKKMRWESGRAGNNRTADNPARAERIRRLTGEQI